MSNPTVAIVGRPNVGKSTLFNRIVGGRRAIVDDRPGVTRDRNFAPADWTGRHFWLIDTGGWASGDSDPLNSPVRQQIQLAIAEADVVVLVVDTQVGVHPADLEVAEILSPYRKRVLVAANKADDMPNDMGYLAFHELGLGEPHPVSATTGKGSGDLLDALVALFDAVAPPDSDLQAIQVAVLGRPNVGKSSLVNRLLGRERSVVAPEAGTTRDAVDSPLRYRGRTLNFIDTAGLRKRSKVEDEIEFYATVRTERALDRADVCVLVVDGSAGLDTQDLKIARKARDKGSGLIIAVNKWDLVAEKDEHSASRGRKSVVKRAPFLDAFPFVYISAHTGLRARKILDLVIEVAEARSHRVPTADVNRVLGRLIERNHPPQKPGKEVKLLYASQVGVRPPTFAVVSNRPNAIPESYRRYLERGFREAWQFTGSPLVLRFRRKRGR
ncbi:MAG: ribosome biogenesis GTPase Der [Gemmatimonadales bacterium]